MALPSIRGRAVHLKFNPRPHTVSESTDVLKILERYGEIEYFRSLQYEPIPARNSAVAIYRNQDGATKACKASPLRFRYGESIEKAQEYGLHATDPDDLVLSYGTLKSNNNDEHSKPSSKSDGDAASDRTLESEVNQTSDKIRYVAPSRSSSKAPGTGSEENDHYKPGREVHLQISASTLNHDLYLKRQFYHETWKPRIRTIMARDLEKKTPIPHLGNFELYKGEVVGSLRKKRDENPTPPVSRLGLLWEKSRATAKETIEES